jgi:hypothetical protein
MTATTTAPSAARPTYRVPEVDVIADRVNVRSASEVEHSEQSSDLRAYRLAEHDHGIISDGRAPAASVTVARSERDYGGLYVVFATIALIVLCVALYYNHPPFKRWWEANMPTITVTTSSPPSSLAIDAGVRDIDRRSAETRELQRRGSAPAGPASPIDTASRLPPRGMVGKPVCNPCPTGGYLIDEYNCICRVHFN